MEILTQTNSSQGELDKRQLFFQHFKNCPMPDNELLQNLGLFMNRQTLSRLLFMDHLYQQIINIHGVVMEFGVRWGQNLSLFSNFRGMYEPYNYYRKIIGFDTFAGFPSVAKADGDSEIVVKGAYGVTENYEAYLKTVLDYHESECPLPHLQKYELVQGDASKTITKYLKDNPETIVALAYFDFDIYEPTRDCLKKIKPHLTKGSVIGFDELNCRAFPGETIAFDEVFGKNNYSIKRVPNSPTTSYIIFE